jgi:hypothetical protein
MFGQLVKYSSAFYGPVAFGTSVRSWVLTGGRILWHSEDERARAHSGAGLAGCIRLRNEDVLQLARQLPIGTPLTIR